MTTREWVEQEAQNDPDLELMLADGLDEAIVGIGQQFNRVMVVYDEAKCLQILIDRDGMSWEEAREFFDYNVQNAWVGEGTPLFLRRPDPSVCDTNSDTEPAGEVTPQDGGAERDLPALDDEPRA